MSNLMDNVNRLVAMQTADIRAQRDKMALALFEVVDAVASVDKPWDLQGHGIEPRRAEEICELAEIGRDIYRKEK